ncbi:hypothetical protein DL764_000065 [Monosporascus ibericus]|uniref:HRDC domain-containing protein n=1 Tax=Monosporascus ibericus TaxID=155417 RepID=A0A4Q4TV54_9PEZI|nr:hypothetical protein DL764_000065 [Monosporascus ibericus]
MEEALAAGNAAQANTASDKLTAPAWPLSYKIPLPFPPRSGNQDPKQRKQRKQSWSHKLYRGPENEEVKALFSTTKQQSEEIARKFLQEYILGPEDSIAPSLRKIIESPGIIKTGVKLSDLHNEVANRRPNDLGLVALAKQVECHLGLPLYKGDDVRKSNWSAPLNSEQCLYAEDDAYASFMLYHCMTAKKSKMNSISAAVPKSLPASIHDKQASSPLVSSPELFKILKNSRLRLGKAANVPPNSVANDDLLQALAQDRPTDTRALDRIKGINPEQIAKFGTGWIAIIKEFLATRRRVSGWKSENQPTRTILSTRTTSELNARGPSRRQNPVGSHTIKPATTTTTPTQDQMVSTIPQLHTGLSFEMAGTKLDGDGQKRACADDSTDSSAFGSPRPMPSTSKLQRKRRRGGYSPYGGSPSLGLAHQQPASSVSCVVQKNPGRREGFAGHEPHGDAAGIDYFADDDESLWAEIFDKSEFTH